MHGYAFLKAAPPSDLLVLLPHTDYVRPSLEISTKTLRRGQIHTDHVTGGHDVAPIVLLFGCQTTGTVDDRAGFASAFMAQHAGMVFTSLTPLLGTHAATLARRLVGMLRDPTRPRCRVGELTTVFRADAVRAGELAALAITAYGDADWRV